MSPKGYRETLKIIDCGLWRFLDTALDTPVELEFVILERPS
jgi:hypothetical protein